MMGQQQMPPQQQQQQQPSQQQMQHMLLQITDHYRREAQNGVAQSWQSGISPENRARHAMQMCSQIRLLQPNQSLQQIMATAVQTEKNMHTQASSQEQYQHALRMHMNKMTEMRNVALRANMAGQPNPQQMPMMGQPQMQQPPAPGPSPAQQMPQGLQPNSQLQRPMQASPMARPPMQAGVPMNGGNPVGMPQPPGGPQQGMPQLPPAVLMQRTAAFLMAQARTNPEMMARFRETADRLPEDMKAQLRANGQDPVAAMIQRQARQMVQAGRIPPQVQQQQQSQPPAAQMAPSMSQRQLSNVDYGAFESQQTEAFRAMTDNQEVVPASNNTNPVPPGYQNMSQAQAALNQRNMQQAAFQRVQAAQAAQAQARQQQQPQPPPQQSMQPGQMPMPPAPNNPGQMLQGGGLNMGGAPSQSPAMPNLNRPLMAPGSVTPQQPPPPHPHQTQNIEMDRLMREAQQRAMVARQGQILTEQQKMTMIPGHVPQQMRDQLMKLPDDQFHSSIQTIRARINAGPAGFTSGQPRAQPNMMNMPPGMPMMNNQAVQGMNGMPGMPAGQQPPNNFNAHPGLNQRLPMTPNHLQQRMQAEQFLLMNPGIVAQSDNYPASTNSLPANIRPMVPPECKTWAQLKAWLTAHPALGVDVKSVLLNQVMQYRAMMQQRQQPNVHVPGQNQVVGQQPMQIPNGLVPGLTPQQQMSLAAMPQFQIAPHELQAARSRVAPNVSDEQLRGMIFKNKLQQHQAQRARMAQQHPAGVAPQVPRPPSMQPQPSQGAVPPKPVAKPPQPAKPAQAPAAPAPKQGVKRPHDDGAGTNDASANAAPQAPAMVASRSHQGIGSMTPEQISNLPANQQEQMRAQLLKAQDASNARPQQRPPPLMQHIRRPDEVQKFSNLAAEVEAEMQARPQPVYWSPEQRTKILAGLQHRWKMLQSSETILRATLALFGDRGERTARDGWRLRARLAQVLDFQGKKVKDEIRMTEAEFSTVLPQFQRLISNASQDLQNFQNGQLQPTGSQAPANAPAQLNAANLAIVERQEQQQRQQQKVPQAPVATRPPFQIGGQSPRGAPTYFEGAPQVTNLKLPDKKRPRLDPGVATPASKASPHAGKDTTPDKRPQAAPQKPAEPRPSFKCKEPDCEYASGGLQSQADLDQHIKESHQKIENPSAFAVEAMAGYLHVDQKTGLPVGAPQSTKAPAAAPRTGAQAARPGQTPGGPQSSATPAAQQAGATPMSRVATASGLKSSPSGNMLRTPQTDGKGPTSAAAVKAMPSQAGKASEPSAVDNMQAINAPMGGFSVFDQDYSHAFSAMGDLTNESPMYNSSESATLDWPTATASSDPALTPTSRKTESPVLHTPAADVTVKDSDKLGMDVHLNVDDLTMTDAMADDANAMDGGELGDIWMVMQNTGSAMPVDTRTVEDLKTLNCSLGSLPGDADMTEQEKMLFDDSYGWGEDAFTMYGDSGLMGL